MTPLHPHTKWLGQTTDYFDLLDSTNLYAKKMAQSGCPEGYTVYAGIQTAGKGSHGRSWLSSSPTGLWVSMVLRPRCSFQQAMSLSVLASYSIASTLRRRYGLDVGIKWPNDCYLNGKKLAGILAETELADGQIPYVILGIGINLYTESFPPSLQQTATSVFRETGIYLDRELLLGNILSDFERFYEQYRETYCLTEILADYNRLLIHQNETIRITYNGVTMQELFCKGIDGDGRLVGVGEDGEMIRVMNGEVSVRKKGA